MPSDTVTITRQEYEDLIDARDHVSAMLNIKLGITHTLSEADMDAYLAAATPLAFWRRRKGFTQAALAQAVGIAQPSLAQAETGRRGLSVETYAKVAKVLDLRIEDLLAGE